VGARNLFQLLVPFAQVARGPIHIAQAVEDSPFDPMLGVGFECDLLIVVEPGCGIEQAEHARMHQIVQLDVNRKILVDPYGDGPHEGQVLENQAVALAVIGGALIGSGKSLCLGGG
jgi:hypothetical protein